MSNNPKIIVIGGGFAGISAVKKLSKLLPLSEITLINKTNSFLFTPLLHEVATGGLSFLSVAESLLEIFSDYKNVKLVIDQVIDVNFSKQTVSTKYSNFDYDYLILATGAKTNHFNIDPDQVLELKTLEDANLIRQQIIDTINKASLLNADQKLKALTFAVIGAGPTGIELVSEMSDFIQKTILKKYQHPALRDKSAVIYLINAGEVLMPNYPLSVQKYIGKVLKLKGINVLNNKIVSEVKDGIVKINDGSVINADTVIWTAGVSAQLPVCDCEDSEKLSFEKSRLVVNQYLQLEHFTNVFVLGDAGCSKENPMPQLAQVATRQGTKTAQNIHNLINNLEMTPFDYQIKGTMLSLGQGRATGIIYGIPIYGILAWFLWRTVYLFKFNSFRKQLRILIEWTANLFFPRDVTR